MRYYPAANGWSGSSPPTVGHRIWVVQVPNAAARGVLGRDCAGQMVVPPLQMDPNLVLLFRPVLPSEEVRVARSSVSEREFKWRQV
jgi:hypothetical protein